MTQTSNENLQRQLDAWVEAVDHCLGQETLSQTRRDAINAFVRTFVPPDVGEDDISYFSENLFNDEVWFFIKNSSSNFL